jgi:hypothetical protein
MKLFFTIKNNKQLTLFTHLIPNSIPIGYFTINQTNFPNELNANEIKFHPTQFTPNQEFNSLLYSSISKNINTCPIHIAQAKLLKQGYMNINDERTLVSFGRTAESEDIFGVVRVDDGVMKPNSFEEMPTHRIYTTQGFFKLNQFLMDCLIKEIK